MMLCALEKNWSTLCNAPDATSFIKNSSDPVVNADYFDDKL
jgi:hypothetical protein